MRGIIALAIVAILGQFASAQWVLPNDGATQKQMVGVNNLPNNLPAEPYAKITMEYIVGCTACDAWWQRDRPALVNRNWHVERSLVIQSPPGILYPRWRVCIGPSCSVIDYTAYFMGKLQQLLDKQRGAWR